MAVTVEDITEAAARGVLRALDARADGQKADTSELVRGGFSVDILIRAGGKLPFPIFEGRGALNPQPLPPGD